MLICGKLNLAIFLEIAAYEIFDLLLALPPFSGRSSPRRFFIPYSLFTTRSLRELQRNTERIQAMATLTLSEKLDQLGNRYKEMTQQLSTPEAVADSGGFTTLAH